MPTRSDPHGGFGRIGVGNALTHMIKGNIGPGCLSFAHAASQVGLVPSLVLLAAIVVIALAGWHMVWQCKVHTQASGALTFGDIGERAFGRCGRDMIEFLVMATQLAVCCVFFSFFAENIEVLPGVGARLTRIPLMLLGLPFFMYVGTLRNLKVMVPFSMVGNVALAVGFGIVLYYCSYYVAQGEPTAALQPSIQGYAIFFGTAVYGLEGVALILPIENAMTSATRHKFGSVMNWSIATIATIFVVVIALPLLSFGYVENASLTAELKRHFDGPGVVVCNLLLVINVAFTYPLQFAPCFQTAEQWVLRMAAERNLRVPFEATDGEIQPLVDSTDPQSDSRTSSADEAMDCGDSVGAQLPPACLAKCPCTLSDAVLRHLCTFPWLRLYLVVFTMGVAAVVPNLGLLIAFFGSLASTSLGLILPPQMYLKLVPAQTWCSRVVCHAITVIGVLGALTGCAASLAEIIKAYE